MTGLDLYEELCRRGIRLPAILTTSHPSPLVRRRAAAAGLPIVEKPFLGNALIDAIRSVLHVD
jgi:FixJ family two-component response regulator